MRTFTVVLGLLTALSSAQADQKEELKHESFLPLPQLIVDTPPIGQRYTNTSSIAVIGRMTKPVARAVRIQLLTSSPQGPTPLMGVSGVHVDEQGQFALTFDPPEGGWPPLGVHVWVTVPGLPQLKGESRFQVMGPGLDAARPVVEARSSGIVIDWDNPPEQAMFVPAGESFIIRGAFVDPQVPDPTLPIRGPSVAVRLMAKQVTYDSGVFHSLRDPRDQSRYLFEIPITVPHGPDQLKLQIHVTSESAKRVGGETDHRGEEITITPAAPQVQPRRADSNG